MTQEEKDLLFKDLSARLPYCVRCKVNDLCLVLVELSIAQTGTFMTSIVSAIKDTVKIEDCKPYLRSIDAMTDKERKRFRCLLREQELYDSYGDKLIDWLNAHYIDYRGLIEKSLALEAPEGIYEY